MTPQAIVGFSVWPIVKWFVLFANLIYIVFSLVVIRQVKLMTDTLEFGYEHILIIISYLNLAFALYVFGYAFLTL